MHRGERGPVQEMQNGAREGKEAEKKCEIRRVRLAWTCNACGESGVKPWEMPKRGSVATGKR